MPLLKRVGDIRSLLFPGCPADVVCGGVDLSGDELGDIIGFHQEGVMVFLLLRQQEGLVCFPFFVYIGNEGAVYSPSVRRLLNTTQWLLLLHEW